MKPQLYQKNIKVIKTMPDGSKVTTVHGLDFHMESGKVKYLVPKGIKVIYITPSAQDIIDSCEDYWEVN